MRLKEFHGRNQSLCDNQNNGSDSMHPCDNDLSHGQDLFADGTDCHGPWREQTVVLNELLIRQDRH